MENGEVIKVTLAYLRERFAKYNTLCFDGQLPTPVLRINNSRTMLGCVRYKKERRLFRKPLFSDFSLAISAYYQLPENVMDDIILHEMIHLDILSNQQHDTSAHGKLFRTKMLDINRRFGRNIIISQKEHLPLSNPKQEQNIIAVSELSDGTWGITRVSPSKTLEIRNDLPKYFKIKNISWYNSRNPYFQRYPRSRTPKIYRIDKEVLEHELEGAISINHIITK